MGNKIKVLFLTQTRQIGPASRYRVYQYIDYLRVNGIECTLSPALPQSCYKFFYQNSNILKKILLLPLIVIKRIYDLSRVKKYDIVFIQREILPQIFPLFEILISRIHKNIIFDFDDAIFLIPPQRNKLFYFLKDKQAIPRIISLSRQVIVGNDYLKEYALQFNKQVELIPTAVDTQVWIKNVKSLNQSDRQALLGKEKIIIGWIGTRHNLFYLEMLAPVFKQLAQKQAICLHIISDAVFKSKDKYLDILNIAWDMNSEVAQVQKFDIAIAPLADDAWGRGKCGLKALQYMACSIPTVCSAVGVYNQIIEDGNNGFLAKNQTEWLVKLTLLINDQKLRQNMGAAGRKTVENNYSFEINKIKLKNIITQIK
ncbi:MAG: glycosyltransferase family 4 protein [Candidatus Omnitrophica bacterium]|nr:glycosyltransferase family 4 protein [Candidatus Omnitrophota bacterium]